MGGSFKLLTVHFNGRPPIKMNVFFQALPELPPPLSGNLYIFFGRQKGIYKVYFLIRARASPPPHLGNAQKKTFFSGGVPLDGWIFWWER